MELHTKGGCDGHEVIGPGGAEHSGGRGGWEVIDPGGTEPSWCCDVEVQC